MTLRDDLKAGDEITIQIAPFGEYPAESVGGVQLVEVFDKEGFEKIIENWKADGAKMIRCDFDHSSEMTDDTVASGWLKDLFIDDDKGLMGTLVVSESGASALNGLDYRFGSPVFVLDDASKPTHLLSYAFTNRPRLKDMDAVYNSEKPCEKIDNSEESPVEEAKVEEETKEEVKEEASPVNNDEGDNPSDTETDMELLLKLKELLGLPEEAVEEDVITSVTEMVKTLKGQRDEELKEEAEEIIDELPIEEEKRDEVIANFVKNPELSRAILNSIKKSPANAVINSAEAQKPDLTNTLKKEYDSLKGGQEKVDFLLAHKGQF